MPNVYRDKPSYPYNPIASLESLSSALDVPINTLRDLAKNQSENYHEFIITIEKKDGTSKERFIKEPKFLLKKVQKRINSRILSKVEYPSYLHGGIKDKKNPRDYYSNALSHVKSYVTISMDVRSFYPSISKDEVIKVFRYFFNFSTDVSNLLSDIVTFDNKVPQGSPTSSYLANLIFFDNEYKLVDTFRKQGLIYTRLLDDITISSPKELESRKIEEIKRKIINMIKEKDLKLNKKKTTIVSKKNSHQLMYVTGLWVNHSSPKCNREERRNIRASVKKCELDFLSSNGVTKEYHKTWNEISGKVAKLQRVGHVQALKLRERLSNILPIISDSEVSVLIREVECIERENPNKINRIGFLKRVNNAIYKVSLISRRNKSLAKSLRDRLLVVKSTNSYSDFWEK